MRPHLGLGLSVLGRPLLRPPAHALRLLPAAVRPLSTFPAASTHLRLHLRRHAPTPRSHPQLHSSIVQLTPHRGFHSTPPRRDIFFLSIPAIKTGLLNITRFSLLFLPFVFRYKLWKKYRRTSLFLLQIPIFAICIVIGLGLEAEPRTGRWRLLLMSEKEEMQWSHRKHKDVLLHDGPLLLPADDPRSIKAGRVATRLVSALEEQEQNIVSGAEWPPREYKTRFENGDDDRLSRYYPSACAKSGLLPFRPASSNPLKDTNIENVDWNIYVIDMPQQLNAFALPSKDLFIYTGLLNLLPDDDTMLAAVLSHEIAHVAQRHSVENAGFLNLAAVAFDVLRGISFALTISFPFITDSAGMFINWLNDVVAERAYSRKLEEEADAVGLEIMAMAGYDPRAMADLWELMGCVEHDAELEGTTRTLDSRVPFLRSHPTSVERYDAINRLMPKAMALWNKHRTNPARPTLAREVQEIQKQLAELDVSPHPPTTNPT